MFSMRERNVPAPEATITPVQAPRGTKILTGQVRDGQCLSGPVAHAELPAFRGVGFSKSPTHLVCITSLMSVSRGLMST